MTSMLTPWHPHVLVDEAPPDSPRAERERRLKVSHSLAYLEGDVPVRTVRRVFRTDALRCWSVRAATEQVELEMVQHPGRDAAHGSQYPGQCRCQPDPPPGSVPGVAESFALCEVRLVSTSGRGSAPTRLWFEYPAAPKWSVTVAGSQGSWELLAFKVRGSERCSS